MLTNPPLTRIAQYGPLMYQQCKTRCTVAWPQALLIPGRYLVPGSYI